MAVGYSTSLVAAWQHDASKRRVATFPHVGVKYCGDEIFVVSGLRLTSRGPTHRGYRSPRLGNLVRSLQGTFHLEWLRSKALYPSRLGRSRHHTYAASRSVARRTLHLLRVRRRTLGPFLEAIAGLLRVRDERTQPLRSR